MNKELNEKIEQRALSMAKMFDGNSVNTLNALTDQWQAHYVDLAKYTLTLELEAEIRGLCFCYPDLNSESGITIQRGSTKDFALKRKIELQQQIEELKNAGN